MTYAEFKELGFPGIMPMENVLAQALFDRKIDVSEVLNAYYHALEAERHKLTSQFEEACVCLNMHYHGDVTMTEAYKMGFEAGKASSWKPSEEQMEALNKARRFIPYNCDILESLYNQLKKL